MYIFVSVLKITKCKHYTREVHKTEARGITNNCKGTSCNYHHLSQGLDYHPHLRRLHVHTDFFEELLLPASLFPLQSDIFAVFSSRD